MITPFWPNPRSDHQPALYLSPEDAMRLYVPDQSEDRHRWNLDRWRAHYHAQIDFFVVPRLDGERHCLIMRYGREHNRAIALMAAWEPDQISRFERMLNRYRYRLPEEA